MPGAKHWSVTPSGKLLSSLTIFVYQKFESSSAEGGWREFFNENCTLFATEEDTEHNLECYNLFKHFEAMLEDALQDFAQKEGKNVHEIHRMISEIDDRNTKASKFLKKLLLSFEYSKFAQIMRDRAIEIASDMSSMEKSTTVSDLGSRSHSEEKVSRKSDLADHKELKEAWA